MPRKKDITTKSLPSIVTTPKPTFGPRLRALRVARGLSIADLAAAAGLHPQTVQQLELGMSSEPRRPTLAALARALKLSDSDLASLVRAK